MSNIQTVKAELDQSARLQQMKVNSRQFALTMALELIKAPNYSVVEYSVPENIATGQATKVRLLGGDVTHVALLAMASDFEAYIMGNLEQEALAAVAAAQAKLNGPRIVRP